MPYLDHAATTPLLPEARDAVLAELERVGNASSLHGSGQRRARSTVEEARERIAAALGVRPFEVVFTSGGTEADNLAVKGLAWARRAAHPAARRVLVGAVEHHAVLDAAQWLADAQGFTLELLEVDESGTVQPTTLVSALGNGDDVAVVSVQWANNEVGTVQPVAELAAAARGVGVPFHTDAVQAVGSVEVDPGAVDAFSLTGHKLGGPVGVGALLVGRGVALTPVLHGGGQERDIRSGTLDVAGIAGFAAAVEASRATRAERAHRLGALRDRLVDGIRDRVPGAQVNGPADPDRRLPGIAHVGFDGCEGDSLLLLLDARGVECSTGSACSAGVARPSHVLLAMGQDEARARGSLRFSLGHPSSAADVEAVLDVLPAVVERARSAGLAALR